MTLPAYIFCTDADDTPHHLCLLVYHKPDGFEPVVSAHGNTKDKSKEFHPLWSSTREKIASVPLSVGPKETLTRVSSQPGGFRGTNCPGQLPRSERQVMHAKHTLKYKEVSSDYGVKCNP